MDEVLLIDKPTGITSHDVVNIIRRRTQVKRVGHAGTLDPLASGLLIILVGRAATKRQAEFMKQDKEYICTARLGLTTDTYDSEGQVLTKSDWATISQISPKQIESTLQSFVGTIQQKVPAFSAIKKNGRKLYQLARKGQIKSEDLPVREVTISDVEILEIQKNSLLQNFTVSFRVVCSSGTYIRSLVHDVGQKLKLGAIVTELRRTKIGDLKVTDAQSIV